MVLIITLSSILAQSNSSSNLRIEQNKITSDMYKYHKEWKAEFINEVKNNNATERTFSQADIVGHYKVNSIEKELKTFLVAPDLQTFNNIYLDSYLVNTCRLPYSCDNTNKVYNRLLINSISVSDGVINFGEEVKVKITTDNIYDMDETNTGYKLEENKLYKIFIYNENEYCMYNEVYSTTDSFNQMIIENLLTCDYIKTESLNYFVYTVQKDCVLYNKYYDKYILNNIEYEGIEILLTKGDILLTETKMEYLIVDELIPINILIEYTLSRNNRKTKLECETIRW